MRRAESLSKLEKTEQSKLEQRISPMRWPSVFAALSGCKSRQVQTAAGLGEEEKLFLSLAKFNGLTETEGPCLLG